MRNPLLRSLAAQVKGLSLWLFAIVVLAVPALAQTQITSGTIQGTVLDANGAAVPGAAVDLKNTETNFSRSLTTDDDGRFAALQLPPGRYTVTVSFGRIFPTVRFTRPSPYWRASVESEPCAMPSS